MSRGEINNMSMKMPMFASANQQQNGDEFDLHDIFAEYFDEFNVDLNSNASTAQQQLNLPIGQGIQTAWHAGSLPSTNNYNNAYEEPSAKRMRHDENLYLPQQSEQQQQQQQQSLQTRVSSGVGALSNRLGFTMQATPGSCVTIAQQQQQQQRERQQQQNQQQAMQQVLHQQAILPSNMNSNMKLPVGVGINFGAMGNIMPNNSSTGVASDGSNGALMSQSYHQLIAGVGASGGGSVSGGGGILPNMQLRTNLGISMPGIGVDKKSIEEQMSAERRQRNREHAKRSRVRKKFLLESLQTQVRGLQDENSTLRMLVQKHIPRDALKIIDECCAKSVLFGPEDNEGVAGAKNDSETKGNEVALLKSDFSLIESLTSGQQNFVLTDPRLPDNPIVFASQGFYELTGYIRDEVLGRNCRFLQGVGTDPRAVDVIRTAVKNGADATACLLNYKADGTPFWNQLFVAALRDADDCIVNYVGVLTMVEPNAGADALEDKVNAAHPIKEEE